MRSADPRYPVGRSRLEAVGVVACAVIMTIATIEVIQSAAMDLADGFVKGCPLHFLPCPALSQHAAYRLNAYCLLSDSVDLLQ